MADDNRQQAAEKALKKVFRKLELPAPAQAPAGLAPDQKVIWELQQEVKQLRDRYNLVIKIIGRIGIAMVTVAAPAFGWDFVVKILDLLGVK
jgi:hypothetical protein